MDHLFLALTNPVPGVEAAFNTWYDTRHVPEVLRYGRGFTGCRRFRLEAELRGGPLPPWSYLALYDLDYEDLAAVAERPWLVDSPSLTPFRGLLEDDHVAWVYSPRGARVTTDSAPVQSSPTAASHLLFCWENLPTPPDIHRLRAAMSRTQGCLAAHAYELASAQRPNQASSPWTGLVILEVKSAAVTPPGDCEAAWAYSAVSDYVNRSDIGEIP